MDLSTITYRFCTTLFLFCFFFKNESVLYIWNSFPQMLFPLFRLSSKAIIAVYPPSLQQHSYRTTTTKTIYMHICHEHTYICYLYWRQEGGSISMQEEINKNKNLKGKKKSLCWGGCILDDNRIIEFQAIHIRACNPTGVKMRGLR